MRGRAIRRHHRQRMIRRMERIIRDCWQTHNSERWIALTARRLADNRAWCSCLGCRNPQAPDGTPGLQYHRAMAMLQDAPYDDGIDYVWPGSQDDWQSEVWIEPGCYWRHGCEDCEVWDACNGSSRSAGRPLTTMQAALAALDE